MSVTATHPNAAADGAEGTRHTLRFDRRRAERHPVSGRVTVMRRAHDPMVYRQPVCSFQLRNMSDTGLAGQCEMPLSVDETVAVFLPPHGSERGVDLLGHVVRCQPADQGYQVAVQFDVRPAA